MKKKTLKIEDVVKESGDIALKLLTRGFMLLVFIAWMQAANADRIKDLTDVAGVRENQLIGLVWLSA